jgi:hypothetical protein
MVGTYVHTYVSGPLLYYTHRIIRPSLVLYSVSRSLPLPNLHLPNRICRSRSIIRWRIVGWCVKRERERGRRWQLECSGNVGLLGGGGASFFCQRWWMSRGHRCTVMPKQERTEEREREREMWVCMWEGERDGELGGWIKCQLEDNSVAGAEVHY